MAELKISFTLGERDLRHFRRELARAMGSVDRSKADQITAAAVSLIARARAADPPDYVRERFAEERHAFDEALGRYTTQRGIDLLRLETDQPFGERLAAFFSRRELRRV